MGIALGESGLSTSGSGSRVSVASFGGSTLDAFARLKTSTPRTLFDSKQLFNNSPYFWDDSQTSGAGTTSSFSSNRASTTIGVSNATAGKRIRQTFQSFNYQPGKGQFAAMTFTNFATSAGLFKEVGLFNDNNGLGFASHEGTLRVFIRSSVSGTPDTAYINQSNWDDPLDGSGPSGYNLDFSMAQIAFFDFEWLGVGQIRFGFFAEGRPILCHTVTNLNLLSAVYMSTPNLPIRYSIENDGTGTADTFEHICSTVQSDGGQEDTGIRRGARSNRVTMSNANTYASLGIQLAEVGGVIDIINKSIVATTNNDQGYWALLYNPTVDGTFNYIQETNSPIAIARGVAANTISNLGIVLDNGFFDTTSPSLDSAANALGLGHAINGTPQSIVLAINPITASIDVETSMVWRELS